MDNFLAITLAGATPGKTQGTLHVLTGSGSVTEFWN